MIKLNEDILVADARVVNRVSRHRSWSLKIIILAVRRVYFRIPWRRYRDVWTSVGVPRRCISISKVENNRVRTVGEVSSCSRCNREFCRLLCLSPQNFQFVIYTYIQCSIPRVPSTLPPTFLFRTKKKFSETLEFFESDWKHVDRNKNWERERERKKKWRG